VACQSANLTLERPPADTATTSRLEEAVVQILELVVANLTNLVTRVHARRSALLILTRPLCRLRRGRRSRLHCSRVGTPSKHQCRDSWGRT
jgi:hypothetical protein